MCRTAPWEGRSATFPPCLAGRSGRLEPGLHYQGDRKQYSVGIHASLLDKVSAAHDNLRFVRVERDGWFIDIETLSVSERPHWEIRCRIRREKDGLQEERGHRFYVADELSRKVGLAELKDGPREELMAEGAKRVILREFEAIFSEPEDGLDSLRPLVESDLN